MATTARAKTKAKVEEKRPMQATGTPPRSVYRNTTIQLLLVPIEVGLYTACSEARSGRQQFVLVNGEHHPVGIKKYDKVTGEEVANEDVVKGFVSENDEIVIVSDEELALATERVAEIVGFVNYNGLTNAQRALLIPTGKCYQVRPATMKTGSNRERRTNKPAEHALSALLEGMGRHDVQALISITVEDGQSPKLGMLSASAQLRLMTFQNHIRQELPLPELVHTAQEQAMMDELIKKFTITELPENIDLTSAHVANLIETKLAGGDVTLLVKPSVPEAVQDLEAMLKASLGK